MRRALPAVLMALAGCATQPAQQSSALTARASSAFISQAATTSIEPVPDSWWRLYGAAELDALIEASLAANADLRVAFANLDSARAALAGARANRLPQTTIESGLLVDDTSRQPSASAVPSTDWDIALTASWELDLFGRLRKAALAARADSEAQQAALEGAKVAVAADTAQAYFDLCGAQQALRQARDAATASERLVELVRQQLAAGEVSPLELSQAATLAASSRAAIGPFEAARANALFRLATLQGRTPAEGPVPSPTCTAPPKLTAPLPVGDGTALLLRRPDIREAERRLAAAAARVGVARADLYPRVTLGGAAGLLAESFETAVTPLLTWAFPNAAPARARISQASAGEKAALAAWDVAVLRGLREVETALSAYDAEMRRNQELLTAESEAERYARRAEARVRLGDAASLVRIDAERTLATLRLQRVQSDLAIAQTQVALFRALGGGWNSTSPAN
ncbi:MAG: TolC family protein [Gammaproteobacteria bacterium]|nr:TolC family protein [Gammaproteobacteria bacterium]